MDMVNAHWRDTARTARFWIVDSTAVFPFLLWLLHMRVWTFAVAVLATAFFSILERWGFTVPVFLRWFRSTIAGPHKAAIPWWRN
jgi:intracellular multiplication protein IcmT